MFVRAESQKASESSGLAVENLPPLWKSMWKRNPRNRKYRFDPIIYPDSQRFRARANSFFICHLLPLR